MLRFGWVQGKNEAPNLPRLKLFEGMKMMNGMMEMSGNMKPMNMKMGKSDDGYERSDVSELPKVKENDDEAHE
jgi:hypothetical protein